MSSGRRANDYRKVRKCNNDCNALDSVLIVVSRARHERRVAAYLSLANRLISYEGIRRAIRSTASPGTKVLLWRQFRLMLKEVQGEP